MTDLEIIELLRNGQHNRALDKLYTGYPAIKSFVLKHDGTEEEVKDVFQEALIIFYQKAIKPDFKLTAKISTYLYSTCKYLWKDKLKVKNKYKAHTDFENLEVWIEPENNLEYKEYLITILDQLGEKCKAILEAYYSYKMSMASIANKFNYSSIPSAKNQKYKCLTRAKKMALELQKSSS